MNVAVEELTKQPVENQRVEIVERKVSNPSY